MKLRQSGIHVFALSNMPYWGNKNRVGFTQEHKKYECNCIKMGEFKGSREQCKFLKKNCTDIKY